MNIIPCGKFCTHFFQPLAINRKIIALVITFIQFASHFLALNSLSHFQHHHTVIPSFNEHPSIHISLISSPDCVKCFSLQFSSYAIGKRCISSKRRCRQRRMFFLTPISRHIRE